MVAVERKFDVFVSCSFSGKVDHNGLVLPEYKTYIDGVLKEIRAMGLTAFCSLEHEEWKESGRPPEEGVNTDIETLIVSERLLALIGEDKSEGVSDEIATARTMGKATYLMLEPGVEQLSYWKQGLVNSFRVKLIESVQEIR